MFQSRLCRSREDYFILLGLSFVTYTVILLIEILTDWLECFEGGEEGPNDAADNDDNVINKIRNDIFQKPKFEIIFKVDDWIYK